MKNDANFSPGDLVECLYDRGVDPVWLPATVFLFWRGVREDGEPANQVDVDGTYPDGTPWHGRFDTGRVRYRVAA